MVKKGPCLHCGINSTPLWRNGPADKPVLCNACGSRYKLRGTLENYLPRHFHLQYMNNLKNVYGGSSHSSHVANSYNGTSNKLTSNSTIPAEGRIYPSFLNSKIPSKKRSPVVYKVLTPMEQFQNQLLRVWKCQRQLNETPEEEVLLLYNVNSFIPSNEIGLGGILLKPDHGTST